MSKIKVALDAVGAAKILDAMGKAINKEIVIPDEWYGIEGEYDEENDKVSAYCLANTFHVTVGDHECESISTLDLLVVVAVDTINKVSVGIMSIRFDVLDELQYVKPPLRDDIFDALVALHKALTNSIVGEIVRRN